MGEEVDMYRHPCWRKLDCLVRGLAVEPADSDEIWRNRNRVREKVEKLIKSNQFTAFCQQLGLLSAGFLFVEIAHKSVIFFSGPQTDGEEKRRPSYLTNYIWRQSKNKRFSNLVHELFVSIRDRQKHAVRQAGGVHCEDFYVNLPHPNEIAARNDESFRADYGIHYCSIGEVLFFLYTWRLLSRFCDLKGNTAIFKPGTITFRSRFNRQKVRFDWDTDDPFVERSVSQMSEWRRALDILFPKGRNSWRNEWKNLALINDRGKPTVWLNCLLEYVKKRKLLEARPPGRIEDLDLILQRAVQALIQLGKKSTAKEQLARLHNTARFPLLPFYFWTALDRSPKTYLVSPVWISPQYQAEVGISSTSKRQISAVGLALCGVAPLAKLDSSLSQGGSYPPEVSPTDPRDLIELLNLMARPLVELNFYAPLADELFALQRTKDEQQKVLAELSHPNFPALDFLPRELRTLLRSVKIPRIAFHTTAPTVKLDQDEKVNAVFASLLRAVPKTDLHVHAGSCMSHEFLVVASLVGLLQHEFSTVSQSLKEAIEIFRKASTKGTGTVSLALDNSVLVNPDDAITFTPGEDWIRKCRDQLRERIKWEPPAADSDQSRYRIFRAIVHQEIGIPAYLEPAKAQAELKDKSHLDLALFVIRHSATLKEVRELNKDDLIRTYILVLAAKSKYSLKGKMRAVDCDLLDFFRDPNASVEQAWNSLRSAFYDDANSASSPSFGNFKSAAWSLNSKLDRPLTLTPPDRVLRQDYDVRKPTFDDDPLGWTLATGLRSSNLADYLQGCEFSGAEHLQHPFLIHLYAEQALLDFMREGVLYAELRCSPDGYVNSDYHFEIMDACLCLTQAFSQAQKTVLQVYRRESNSDVAKGWLGDVLGPRYGFKAIEELFPEEPEWSARHLPCKVGIILVGKRHKSTQEMILEAAATAVLKPSVNIKGRSVEKFSVEQFEGEEMAYCRIVGFDLAGKEAGIPPRLFAEEFSRLSKLHVPLTVHAGENASSQFIEESILELGARRIGHGLALIEDKALMARVREEQVCIELCPVSNHQTSHFGSPDDPSSTRQYPLEEFLKAGLLVTINTDNPIISDTNLVKEYFQASFAYDTHGLSLWEALRIIRMGYVSSFLSLPERHALLIMADIRLPRLFTDPAVVAFLRDVHESKGSNEGSLLEGHGEP
ncbi:MAG: hypothetical protein HYS58_03610 [Elusimicrobia bacterium]|nr:hypothetical protein [Elusimicrobiota bacterium]